MYPKKVEKLALLAVPPGRLLFQNMDLHQLSNSFYMWQFLVPGVMERLLPANDWDALRPLFDKATGGLIRQSMPPEEIEYYKDALAVKGAVTGGLNYYRCAARAALALAVLACLARRLPPLTRLVLAPFP